MYDVRNEAHEFVGTGREEAVQKACQFYGVEVDELEISGFPDGAVYGLTTRTVIVAIPKNAQSTPRSRSDAPRREERRDEGGRGEGRREAQSRGRDRGRGRDGGRDRDRGRGRDSGRDRDRGRRPDSREGRSGDRGRSRQERPEIEEVEMSDEPTVSTVSGELGEVGDFVLGVMERMDLGPFEIEESQEDELIVVALKGVAAKTLASGEGRTVDALQLLVNQVVARISPERQRVVIDIEGNVEARQEFLTKLADRAARRALQTSRPVALDPMNGSDRRAIHIALRDRDDIATMSEGEGRYRQVMIVPEGSDEFEEALEQSKRSSES